MLMKGTKTFWSWLKRTLMNEQYSSFLEGILPHLDLTITGGTLTPDDIRLVPGNPASFSQSEEVIGMKIYTSEQR
jgi:hypothetical protein